MPAIRIAIVVSHPIQHFCPQYASFAKNDSIKLKVFFGSALGYRKYTDVNFKTEIAWTNLKLDQFDHVFLNGDRVLQPCRGLDAPSLNRELEKFNPSVVITYGYFQKLQRRAKKWAARRNISLAYISDAENRRRQGFLKGVFKFLFLKKYFKSFSYFLTVGDANEAFYKNYGVPASRMIRMHFPIDAEYYKMQFAIRSKLAYSIREEYDIPENAIVLSVVGKLVSWKNQDHIIDAMQTLGQKGLSTYLFIIGSGPSEEFLKQKARVLTTGKVYFSGFIHPEKLPAFYAATDIYIHPASVEPHSLSISEAIYMGCPVILSDQCGSYGDTDDVRPGENGFVYPFGNIPELAKQVEKLMLDEALRKRFSNASHLSAERFQRIAHVEVIHSILAKEIPVA